MKAWKRIAALMAVAVIVPAVAMAQGMNVQEADKRFQEGLELFKKKKYPEAHVKFTEACAAHRTSQCPKNLAMAEMRLGRHAESAMHFREYVRSPEFTADPDAADIQKFFTEEQTKVGELHFIARDGAVIKVDEVPIGKAPLADTWFVVPGKHDAAATYGDDKQTKTVDVPNGKVVDCDLSPPVVATAIPSTSATVPTAPSSTATGVPTTTTPPTYSRPTAGYAVPIALGVLGVGALATGIGFGVSSTSSANDATTLASTGPCADMRSANCARLEGLRTDQNSASTMAMIGYIASPILIAAAVIAWFAWPKTQSNTSLVPAVGPKSGALVLTTSF